MILDRVHRFLALVGRATPGPLLVCGGIAWCAAGALFTAYPQTLVTGRLGLALVLLAMIAMFAPRGRAVTFVALAAVVGWLLSTMGYAEPVALWRVFGVAALLYLMHSLAALAAVLPHDAVVSGEVLTRWVGRDLLVVAGSATLLLVVVVAANGARGAYLLASLVGLVAAVAVTALLTHLLSRR